MAPAPVAGFALQADSGFKRSMKHPAYHGVAEVLRGRNMRKPTASFRAQVRSFSSLTNFLPRSRNRLVRRIVVAGRSLRIRYRTLSAFSLAARIDLANLRACPPSRFLCRIVVARSPTTPIARPSTMQQPRYSVPFRPRSTPGHGLIGSGYNRNRNTSPRRPLARPVGRLPGDARSPRRRPC